MSSQQNNEELPISGYSLADIQKIEAVISELPDDKKQIIYAYISQKVYPSSPLPPAIELKAYCEVIPDAPERLLKEFEKQAEHRRNAENQLIKQSNRGQILSFLIVVICIIAVVFTAQMQYYALAMILAAITLARVAFAFIGKQK